MSQRSATEITSKFATTVDSLSDAWSFIMDHMDSVGAAPSVTISPIWISDDDFRIPYFEVSISGMIQKSID